MIFKYYLINTVYVRNFDISQGVAHMKYFLIRNLTKKFQIFVTLHKFEILALSHMEIYADLQIFDKFLLDF